MAKILKFWHQYGFIVTIIGYIFLVGMNYGTYKSAMASTDAAISAINDRHDKENLDNRMSVQETLSKDTKEQLGRMELVQGQIFNRINQIADRRP